MKRRPLLFTSLLFLLITATVTAQQGEPVLATVTYIFIHVNDTSNRTNPIKEDMALCLAEHSSKYTNAIQENRIRNSEKAIRNMPAVPPPIPKDGSVKIVRGHPIAIVYGRGYTFDCLFQYLNEKKLNKIASLGSKLYLIESPLPKINWKLDKETRTIGDYTCQKAVGDFAGRTYTAWFTNELPFRSGPWKLNGLPGLILEATDSRNEVSFLYKSISKDTADRNTALFNKDLLVKANEKAYERAYESYLSDPKGVMLSQVPGETNVTVGYVDSTGKMKMGDKALPLIEQYKKETVATTNNPLELKKQ